MAKRCRAKRFSAQEPCSADLPVLREHSTLKKGGRKPGDAPKRPPPLAGLNWRQALERYAPRIVICQCCNTHCLTEMERVERLCSFHLYACGLGMQVEAIHSRLVRLLARRVAFLQAQTDAADSCSDASSC